MRDDVTLYAHNQHEFTGGLAPIWPQGINNHNQQQLSLHQEHTSIMDVLRRNISLSGNDWQVSNKISDMIGNSCFYAAWSSAALTTHRHSPSLPLISENITMLHTDVGNYISDLVPLEVQKYMRPANERRRYNVTSSLIGWAHTQNDLLESASCSLKILNVSKIYFSLWMENWQTRFFKCCIKLSQIMHAHTND